MYTSHSFSSLLQTTNAPLTNTASALLSGLKIRFDQSWYICGSLALSEGSNPIRSINISPEGLEYQVLFRAALLVANNNQAKPMVVTVGFPNNTYRLFKDLAHEKLPGSYQIQWDAEVYGGNPVQPASVQVDQIEVLPEIVSCMIALRKGVHKINGSFFIISLGFGTFETGLSTDDGVVENAMESAHGIHYAVNLLREEILQTHSLSFKNVQQLNEAFRDGYLYINRKKIDLVAIRARAIKIYYKEVVLPMLHLVISDQNLKKTDRIFVCGGGAHYSELLDCITKEFGEFCHISIVEQPETLAAQGYLLNSLRFTEGTEREPVGIDMGNIETRVTLLKER